MLNQCCMNFPQHPNNKLVQLLRLGKHLRGHAARTESRKLNWAHHYLERLALACSYPLTKNTQHYAASYPSNIGVHHLPARSEQSKSKCLTHFLKWLWTDASAKCPKCPFKCHLAPHAGCNDFQININNQRSETPGGSSWSMFYTGVLLHAKQSRATKWNYRSRSLLFICCV